MHVILSRHEGLASYVEPCLTKESYQLTYSEVIFPPQNPVARDWIPDFEYSVLGRGYVNDEVGPWVGGNLTGPKQAPLRSPRTRRPAGRPKKNRQRSRGETPPRPLHCSRCGGDNHNRSTCTEPIGSDPDVRNHEDDVAMDEDVLVLEVTHFQHDTEPRPTQRVQPARLHPPASCRITSRRPTSRHGPASHVRLAQHPAQRPQSPASPRRTARPSGNLAFE
jgi:hypothetical protein